MKRLARITVITGLVLGLMYASGTNAIKRTANTKIVAVSTFGGNPPPLCLPHGCLHGQ